ncbi:TetR/AcrR family transcriptional regulator [Nonomuraea sp. NPDC050643]|uniref:TetR/AcrR family transcriptional regulator n=1 Tax=Nonomuraea sp. NPDC050643 TaxID=3155660 RepID=UPI0033C4D7BF
MATIRDRAIRDGAGEQGDRRMRRTQAALRGALIELVQQQNLSRVSVADVAERAGVGRSTFYDHYRDVHELAEAACTAMIDELIDAIPGHVLATGGPPDTLLIFFTHLAEHAGLYRSVLGPQGSARLIDHVRRRATVATYVSAAGGDGPLDCTADTPHDVPAAFTAGALLGVATDWLQRGCPRTAAEMAARTRPLLMTLYQGGDRTAG